MGNSNSFLILFITLKKENKLIAGCRRKDLECLENVPSDCLKLKKH